MSDKWTMGTDTITVGGITLSEAEANEMYHLWHDGRCPVCLEEINLGAVVCDDCLRAATSFRRNSPPVLRDYSDPKYYRGRQRLFKGNPERA